MTTPVVRWRRIITLTGWGVAAAAIAAATGCAASVGWAYDRHLTGVVERSDTVDSEVAIAFGLDDGLPGSTTIAAAGDGAGPE